ncbi:MAG: tetratricopeptide repeat protein [Anaerolineales bacterium]|nr:MAG: tetratricopeptide repeat protein [Anaerolineales bacterium]
MSNILWLTLGLSVTGCSSTPSLPTTATTPAAILTPPWPTSTATPVATPTLAATSTPTPTPTVALTPLAERVFLAPMTHEYQKLNNCGPVALAIALSYYGVERTQFDIAPLVKGYDKDKNVSPEEMVAYLTEVGLRGKARLNGDTAILMTLVSNGIPVIVGQWLERPHDGVLVGHYRVVRGYDQGAKVIVVNDPYTGPEARFSYALFDERWRPFNRCYIPVYLPEQEAVVRAILGADWEDEAMSQRALASARWEVEEVGDNYAWFNLGDDYLAVEKYGEAADAYGRALEMGFPSHFLWYHYGPLEAYNALGEYQKVLSLSEEVLTQAPDIEEILYQRGLAYLRLGEVEKAKTEFGLAVRYNPNYTMAIQALAGLGE